MFHSINFDRLRLRRDLYPDISPNPFLHEEVLYAEYRWIPTLLEDSCSCSLGLRWNYERKRPTVATGFQFLYNCWDLC
jgi:hypothetical protein